MDLYIHQSFEDIEQAVGVDVEPLGVCAGALHYLFLLPLVGRREVALLLHGRHRVGDVGPSGDQFHDLAVDVFDLASQFVEASVPEFGVSLIGRFGVSR